MEKNQIKVGWIGTGVMGSHMAKHLMNNGYTNMYVYNRTASKADELVALGAKFLESPAKVAQEVDYLFLMLGYPHDVQKMVYEGKDGLINHMKKGSYLIDHTTSSPGLAIQIAKDLLEKGVHCIDAPVSGGDVGAKAG